MSTFVSNNVASGAVIKASDHNEMGSRIAAVVNGGLEDANISSGAAINGSKIAAGTIAATSLASSVGNFGAWATWTPTLTNLTLGSGTIIAKYSAIGKTVSGYFRFVMGSGSSVNTGSNFSLPIPAQGSTYVSTSNNVIGSLWIDDAGISNYQGTLILSASLTAASPIIYQTSGTYSSGPSITATTPMTWGIGDSFNCSFTYEAA